MESSTLTSQLSPPEIPVVQPKSFDLPIEERVLRIQDQEFRFPFLVIDQAEKWVEASQIRGVYKMPIVGTSTSLAFPMRGPSLQQWEAIEARFVVPEWQDDGDPPQEFTDNRKSVVAERRVAMLECCLDKSIPGNNAQEKIAFLNERCPGELEALFQYIENSLCNWAEAPDSQLLNEYNRVAQKAMTNKVVEFASFDDWKKANETQYVFRMQRPTDDYIVEVPINGLSRAQKEEIQERTKESIPPMVPIIVEGKFDRSGRTRPNYQDPSWLKRTRTLMQTRTVMYFDACLPFSIPGGNIQERYDWISKRLVGDITKIQGFIEGEILSFGSRYNFFTKR